MGTKSFFVAVLTLFCTVLSAQSSKDQIIKSVSDYFSLDRENIHVQFNKNIFVTDEQVWFKGYVFNRKKNTPFFETTNVYVSLINEFGQKIGGKLLYTEAGIFSGSFRLNGGFKSGRYFLQFYTNWMNNFAEDESATYQISIVNPVLGVGTAFSGTSDKTTIAVIPEGGQLISGISNNIGIAVTNDTGNPIGAVDIVVANGTHIATVPLNEKGYGSFNFIPEYGKEYKAIVRKGSDFTEQSFYSLQSGVRLTVNNVFTGDNIFFTVSANKEGVKQLQGKPLYLLVHKDDKAVVYELNFEGTDKITLVLPCKDITEGLYTARLINSQNKEVAQRLFFNFPKEEDPDKIDVSRTNTDNITIRGFAEPAGTSLSASILPGNTQGYDSNNDIFGSLWLLPYIDAVQKPDGKYYFSDLTRIKKYELDNYLLCQQSKYRWNTITAAAPSSNYLFDRGLILTGTVSNPSKREKKSHIRLLSVNPIINERTSINNDGKFVFENLHIADSSRVSLEMIDEDNQVKIIHTGVTLTNAKRAYNKPYKPALLLATNTEAAKIPVDFDFAKQAIQLKEVSVEGERLTRTLHNTALRGYKITESDRRRYINVIDYLKSFGKFNFTDNNDGRIDIKSGIVSTSSVPVIYIDDVRLTYFNNSILHYTYMSDVDEIYISWTEITAGMTILKGQTYKGIIKIYLRKWPDLNGRTPDESITISGGFDRGMPFKNIPYKSTADDGFIKYGVIDWQPQIAASQNNAFNIKLPAPGQKKMRVIIEGFNAKGKLIHEEKIIETP